MAKNRDLSKLANRLTVDNNYNVGISGSLTVTGSIISTVSTLWSGSAQLPSGVVSGSAQTIANLPSGVVSGSAQTIAHLPSGTVSGSAQVLNGTTIHSGTFFNGVTVVSGSGQISYTGITNVPSGIISGSSQLPSGVVSGSAQTIAHLPSGTVSGSAQVDVMSTTNIARLATTGSNTFQGTQTVNGSLVVTGSLTAQQFIVSSSVTYLTESFASGSHKFGDSSDDYHDFTGSVRITGSINVTGSLLTTGSSVGIGGQANPVRTLHVMGQGAFDMTHAGVVIQESISPMTSSQIVSYKQTNAVGSAYRNMHLRADVLGVAIMSGSGYVSIGKDTANSMLDVNGNTIISGSLYVTGSVNVGASFGNSQLYVGGLSAQTSSALLDSGTRNGLITILSAGGTAGNGGGIVLGTNTQGNDTGFGQIALKAILIGGAGQGTSDFVISTRNATSDTALTERLRLTSGGSLGLGIVPPTDLYSGFKSLQVGTGMIYGGASSGGYVVVQSNCYYDGTNVKYIYSSYARQISCDSAGFTFNLAGTGTSGATITWNPAMTLDPNGNLLIGNTTDVRTLSVWNSDTTRGGARLYNSSTAYSGTTLDIGSESSTSAYNLLNIRYGVGMPNVALRVRGDGYVGVGSSDMGYGLLTVMSTNNTTLGVTEFGTSSGGAHTIAVYNLSQTVNSAAGIKLVTRNSGAAIWGMYNQSLSANAADFVIGNGTSGTGYERLRITNGGSVFHKTPSVGGYSPFIGTVAPNANGGRYCHVRINTVGGMMVWIKVMGYQYAAGLIEGLCSGYIYSSDGQLFNNYNSGSIPIVYQKTSTTNYIEVVIDMIGAGTTNRWGSFTLLGGTDNIQTPTALEIVSYSFTATTAQVY